MIQLLFQKNLMPAISRILISRLERVLVLGHKFWDWRSF